MSYGYSGALVAAQATADARATFMRRVYGHLAGAILAFAAIEFALLRFVPDIKDIILSMFSGWMILVMFVAFVVVSHVATIWAQSDTSVAIQYLGLSLYVVVEAVIFLPLLYVADTRFPGAIQSAGILSLAVFGGLSLAVLLTRKDYSYLGPIIAVSSLITVGVIVAAMLLHFPLGLWFSFAMVALACACILYQTSNVLHHYRTTQHVAASLALFASVAVLFYYVLRIAIQSRE
jgi:FtsH-binding integral membrane protein